jgi:hypothetical protein
MTKEAEIALFQVLNRKTGMNSTVRLTESLSVTHFDGINRSTAARTEGIIQVV